MQHAYFHCCTVDQAAQPENAQLCDWYQSFIDHIDLSFEATRQALRQQWGYSTYYFCCSNVFFFKGITFLLLQCTWEMVVTTNQ